MSPECSPQTNTSNTDFLAFRSMCSPGRVHGNHVLACLTGLVYTHGRLCYRLALSQSLRSVCLNAPRRSRPRSGAAVGQWGRYLCRTATSPRHRALRVGPLGSTSVVRNRWGCTNVGHQVTLTWRERRSLINTSTHVSAYVHRRCSNCCDVACESARCSVHRLCSATYWLESKASLALLSFGC